jgi:hypothetical protein
MFSTVSDMFLFDRGLSLEELEEIYGREHGEVGMRELPQRLERARKYGTSWIDPENLEDTLATNQHGDDGEPISYDECIKRFLS